MHAKPLKHLINILKTTKDHHPNFTLFLGAGASITSGIKSAREMISEWKASYIDMYGADKLKAEPWFEKGNEYSELFERLYDQPTQRREYIERCINNSNPSWGYVYLVNLLKEKTFNTVFTTNFDDLINEACYTFSNNLRPVVCAHDSSIKNIRLTSNRPKIIKLHGDFLFDDLKNTIRELESLEDNMRTKFKQYASEFGMIVMGYAGNDRSIMDTLNTLLHSDNSFPHGIYWCIRKGTELERLPEELKNLARFSRFHLIEIDGFDEAMAEIHHSLSLPLQEEVSDPYSALSSKLDKYFSGLEDDEGQSQLIKKDMRLLSEHVIHINSAKEFISNLRAKMNEFSTDIDSEDAQAALSTMLKETEFLKNGKNIHIYSMPNILLANSAFHEQDFRRAKDFAERSLTANFSIESMTLYLRSLIMLAEDDSSQDDLEQALENYIPLIESTSFIDQKDGNRLISLVVDLMSKKDFVNAMSILDIMHDFDLPPKINSFVIINKSLIFRISGDEISSSLLSKLTDEYEKAKKSGEHWLAFGFAILIGDETKAMECADSLDESQIHTALSDEMPIFGFMSQAVKDYVAQLGVMKGYIEPEEVIDMDSENEIFTSNDSTAPNDQISDTLDNSGNELPAD
jgi:hypothetical protein